MQSNNCAREEKIDKVRYRSLAQSTLGLRSEAEHQRVDIEKNVVRINEENENQTNQMHRSESSTYSTPAKTQVRITLVLSRSLMPA